MIEGRFVARSDDPIIYRVLFDDGTGFSKSARSHGNSDTQGPGHPLALECLLGGKQQLVAASVEPGASVSALAREARPSMPIGNVTQRDVRILFQAQPDARSRRR